jgi:hypothetical protein
MLKLSHSASFVTAWTDHLGYSVASLTAVGLLELACLLVYLVPRTAVLGAVLLTGYLGGAIASHVRIGEPFTVPLVLGILVWVGLHLRDERLRTLVARQIAAH